MEDLIVKSAEKLAAAVLVREAAIRLAVAGQAVFWLEVGSVRNISVRDYEDPNLGISGISGEFLLKGTLHVQPKGATWSAQFPVHHKISVSEHPPSSTYVFSPVSRDPMARLLALALQEYDAAYDMRKALGHMQFVPYEKAASRKAEIVAPPAVIVGDIFYSSWGYEQTNVDYYQVTKTTPSMILIREVKKKITRGLGKPVEFVIPLANQFVGPALRKKLLAYNGRAMVRLNSFSRAYKWDGQEKGQTGGGYGH